MTRTLPPVAPGPSDAFAAPVGVGAGVGTGIVLGVGPGAAVAVFGQALPDDGVALLTEAGPAPPNLDEDLLDNLFD